MIRALEREQRRREKYFVPYYVNDTHYISPDLLKEWHSGELQKWYEKNHSKPPDKHT
jgi:hypothetical protein